MATKIIEKKMQAELNELYGNEGRITREIASYQNILVDDELNEFDRTTTEKLLNAAQVNLEKIQEQIDVINGNVIELKEKEREATEYKWKDVEPLLKQAVEKHYMSYCVESNKFVYCMDMASKIKDEESGTEYVVVNPQFRSFDAVRAERVISKLIGKFLTDANFRIIKWFMTNDGKTHFQATASFLYSKWNSDKVYNKANVIQNFWVKPDTINYESYNKDFDLLLYCVGGGKQENIDHLEKWCVYKYWFPERVANTPNLDICGPLGANGKGRYLELCKTIFTYGCVSPGTAKELNDGFNASWEMSTLVYFDEPTEKELPSAKVKNATGGEEQRIEKKGVDAYTADRNYSIIALSNNEEGVFRLNGGGMAGQDRRFSVISTDIVVIDEIMKRENCTFEEATIRVNNIAQMVKDRNEVSKWMGHIMIKHSVPLMKILAPLHGEDYNKRFEDQKDKTSQIFDKFMPIFKENGCMPVEFITDILNNLLTTDKKTSQLTGKSVSTKFKTYLQKNRVDYDLGQKQNIRILYDGIVSDTLERKSIFYYDKTQQPINDFNFNTISDRPYSKIEGLAKNRIKINID
jgi:hypothetical protein